jgi:hypothetical protein
MDPPRSTGSIVLSLAITAVVLMIFARSLEPEGVGTELTTQRLMRKRKVEQQQTERLHRWVVGHALTDPRAT